MTADEIQQKEDPLSVLGDENDCLNTVYLLILWFSSQKYALSSYPKMTYGRRIEEEGICVLNLIPISIRGLNHPLEISYTLAGNPIVLQEIPKKSFCFWPPVASYTVHTETYQGT